MARDLREGRIDVFDNTPQRAADATWPPKADAGLLRGTRERLDEIPLDWIKVDKTQPRRAIPWAVRRASMQTQTKYLLAEWVYAVYEETADTFPLEAIVAGDEHNYEPESAMAASLFSLCTLAADIRREGLTNPITVMQRASDIYLLETGERRYLAHILLAGLYPEDEWTKIKARIVEETNPWRQASENTARADLNAIARARQYALLLMDLLRLEGVIFNPLDEFDHERDFYAQVIDERIPHGKADRLAAAMGFQHRSAVSRHRALLGLDYRLWEQSDDLDVPEGVLRKVLDLPAAEGAKLIAAWQEGNRENVAIGNNSRSQTSSLTSFWDRFGAGTRKRIGRAAKLTETVWADDSKRESAISELKAVRDIIDEALNQLGG